MKETQIDLARQMEYKEGDKITGEIFKAELLMFSVKGASLKKHKRSAGSSLGSNALDFEVRLPGEPTIAINETCRLVTSQIEINVQVAKIRHLSGGHVAILFVFTQPSG